MVRMMIIVGIFNRDNVSIEESVPAGIVNAIWAVIAK